MLSLASGESMQRTVPHECCGSSAAMCNRLMGHIWCATGWVGLPWSGAGLLSQECGASCPNCMYETLPNPEFRLEVVLGQVASRLGSACLGLFA